MWLQGHILAPYTRLEEVDTSTWPEDAPIWVHFNADTPELSDWLLEQGVADTVTEALLADDTRPRCSRMAGGIQLTLRGINLNPESSPEDMVSLRLWLQGTRCISVQKRPLQTLQQLCQHLETGQGPQRIDELIAAIIEGLVDRIGLCSHDLEDRLDDLEDKALVGTISIDDALTHLRQQLIPLQRFLEPQRLTIQRLLGEPVFNADTRTQVEESLNLLTRYVEDISAMQERAQVLQERQLSLQNEQLNRRMYLLGVITAIFLPLSFLTGLFGINLGGMPGAETPTGFWWFSGLLVVMGAIVAWRLKESRWW